MARRRYRRWIPPAVGLVPEDFYGRAVDITDVMFRFKQKFPGRVVKWDIDNSKIPSDLFVDIKAADMREAQQVSVALIKWLGRNGLDVYVEEPLQQIEAGVWRFKCQIKAV
jgi:hypothetical protein